MWQWSSGCGSGLVGVAGAQCVMSVTACPTDCPVSETAEVQDRITAAGAGEWEGSLIT